MAFKSNEVRGEVFENFGEKLKKLREQKQLTQLELAKDLNISKTSIANYESGTRKVPLDIIVKISNYFNVSVDNLLGLNFLNKANNEQDINTGKELKKLRENNQLSLMEMSKELDIDVSSLANFETGVSKVPIDILIKFATYFNVSIDDLVGIHNENESNDFKGAIFSKNPHFAEQYKKWKNELGTINFTNEELDEIINFAKYLVSKRTQ